MGERHGGSLSAGIICYLVFCGGLLVLLPLGARGHVKLNVPRVRLPYFEGLSVNFTLKVDTPGCYSWSISRNDLVTISTPSSTTKELESGLTKCADSAVISTIPRVSSCCPASAIVFAEDQVTKETVRCDVIIDKISAIQILTTTKELHLEEAPSKFHIQGYGSKDNELSTLDGIPFTWLLDKSKSSVIDPQSIMRFIPFSESPYKASPGVATLESRRMQGDTVLLEGIKTGSAEIIARVNDPLYKGLEARVRIIVVASLLLEPSEIWVVPGTSLPLTLWQIKHGIKHQIRLPSSVYEFSVEGSNVAVYDRSTSEITALDYGDAKISVQDKNWVDELEEYSEALTTKIHVTEPKYLSLNVNPYKNWALVMGNKYEIQVDVYNAENQKIFVGDNLFVETTFDPKFFRVEYSSANGTFHIGTPIKLGSSYVTAVLKKIVTADGTEKTPSPEPRVKTEMEIFQNVALIPKETVLPWDPDVMPKYDLRWNPSGGNGNYVWSSSNPVVVTVSQSATGRTESFGSANVSVSTTVNPNMRATAQVHILPPTKMEIVEHIVEAEIGTAIQVPLAFYTIRPNDPNKTQVPYSSCGKLPIKVDVADPSFVYDEKTHYPHLKPACLVLPIMGNALGSSRVTAIYSSGDLYFEDSVIVSTFKPLQTVEPENEMIVLAIGSTKQIVFEGGPRPLLERHTGFEKSLTVTNGTVASHKAIKLASGLKDDVYVFEVLCKEIGDTDAVFRIGNTKVSEQFNSQPIVRIKVVRVICSEPSQMYFKVETPLKSKCPNDGSSAQVVRVAVPNYEPTLVSVVVKDSEGRKFDNITSLKIDWKSQPASLDFATPNYAVTEHVQAPLGYVDTGKGLQTVIPSKISGNVEVFAKVRGYRDEVLNFYSIKSRKLAAQSEEELSELQHSMDLTLVSDVTISPSASVSLFNHPSSKAIVKVKDGSGYFEVDTGNSNKINVSYDQTTKSLEIRPIHQGKARIVLKDLCVSTKRETAIDVDITGIGKIDVVSEDKIPVGGEKIVTVSLQDQNGKLLPTEIIKLVKLSLRPMSFDVLEVAPIVSDSQQNAKFQFKIIGKRTGTAEIVFTVEGGKLFSVPKLIDVFPPLKLSPKSLTVLPGNIVEITASGGPSDADIIFSVPSDAKNVAAISSPEPTLGSIKALGLGKTLVIGRSVDPVTQKVYSEDKVELKVVSLTALKVVAPLGYLYENEKMPIWFRGLSGRTEISAELVASASPSLTNIEWTVSNGENAEIIKIFENAFGSSLIGKDLRTQFHALKTGNLTVHVKANYHGSNIVSHKMEIDIRTYPFGAKIGDGGGEPVSYAAIAKLSLQSLYYWLFLPSVVLIAVIVGSITYNSYIYGEQGKGPRVDTRLFVTSPYGTPQSPSVIRYTPSPSNSSPSTSSSRNSAGRTSGSPSMHRRLFSTFDSGYN